MDFEIVSEITDVETIAAFRLAMKKAEKQSAHFVVCLNNEGYKASLEVGKLYRSIPDKEAEVEGLIRVVDESGEDYAFAANRFHPVDLPAIVEEVLLAASHA
jgi:hypothetical protein